MEEGDPFAITLIFSFAGAVEPTGSAASLSIDGRRLLTCDDSQSLVSFGRSQEGWERKESASGRRVLTDALFLPSDGSGDESNV